MWDASCGRLVRRPLNFLARQRLRWNGASDSYCCDYLAALHWRKWWQNKLASCDYLCSGWEPSHPYGPADSGSFIWDSHWPLATGIITGWAGSYTEARLEQQLKSSLSHRPVPALRIGGGWKGGGGGVGVECCHGDWEKVICLEAVFVPPASHLWGTDCFARRGSHWEPITYVPRRLHCNVLMR